MNGMQVPAMAGRTIMVIGGEPIVNTLMCGKLSFQSRMEWGPNSELIETRTRLNDGMKFTIISSVNNFARRLHVVSSTDGSSSRWMLVVIAIGMEERH